MSDEVEQLNSRGELRHLINLGGLDRANLEEIIEEMRTTRVSERAGRVIDKDQDASMEQKKREGYF